MLVPGVGRKILKRALRTPDSGVVDEDVEPMEGALNMLRQRFHRAQIGDIAFDDGALVAAVLNGRCGMFECGARASAENGVRTQRGELAGDGRANAATGAGDDRDLS